MNLPIKTTVAQVNYLLQHYGTDTSLGNTLMAALKHLQLKIRVGDCLLSYDFENTDAW